MRLALPLAGQTVLDRGSREEFTEDKSIFWLAQTWGCDSWRDWV